MCLKSHKCCDTYLGSSLVRLFVGQLTFFIIRAQAAEINPDENIHLLTSHFCASALLLSLLLLLLLFIIIIINLQFFLLVILDML